MRPEIMKNKLVAALDYFAVDLKDKDPQVRAMAEIVCGGIHTALVFVEASLTLPETSKERQMQLFGAKDILRECEAVKIAQTGKGFDFEVAA